MTDIELQFTFKDKTTATQLIPELGHTKAQFHFPKIGWVGVEHSNQIGNNDAAIIRRANGIFELATAVPCPLTRGQSLQLHTGSGRLVITHLPKDTK